MASLHRSHEHPFPLQPTRQSWRTIGLRRSPIVKLSIGSCTILLLLLSLIYSIEDLGKFAIYYSSSPAPPLPDFARPPVYTELRKWELNFPQHNLGLPYPEGKLGRYVFFSNSRTHLSGWNNKLNDMLMNTWIAYMSGRAYVFHEFVWVDSHYPWPVESYREWPPRTPLNAFISGPSAGGPWDEGDTAPRAVSEEYFNIVCPRQERKIINTRDVKPALREADGKVIFERWRTLLAETKERCVEVVAAPREEDPFPETFDIFYWSGPRSLSLWYDFVQSPISRLLRASPIVKSAIEDNIGLFTSSPLPSLPSSKNHGKDLLRDTFASVFSIHIRSGDFKGACIEHAAMNSTFYNWNLLPFLPDRMNTSRQHEQNKRQILQRCWPNKEYIRERVNEAWQAYKDSQTAPSTGRELPVLYIMSNDRTDWLNGLKEEFQQDGWRRVVLSRELELKPEQKDVSVAVDMEIGRQSAVFIGNGWSSFTSNVVHGRLADGKVPISIRFW